MLTQPWLALGRVQPGSLRVQGLCLTLWTSPARISLKSAASGSTQVVSDVRHQLPIRLSAASLERPRHHVGGIGSQQCTRPTLRFHSPIEIRNTKMPCSCSKTRLGQYPRREGGASCHPTASRRPVLPAYVQGQVGMHAYRYTVAIAMTALSCSRVPAGTPRQPNTKQCTITGAQQRTTKTALECMHKGTCLNRSSAAGLLGPVHLSGWNFKASFM